MHICIYGQRTIPSREENGIRFFHFIDSCLVGSNNLFRTYPGWRLRGVEAELVHDPAGLDAVGRPALVEHQSLPHADDGARGGAAHLPVLARRLPVSSLGGAVRSRTRRVLAVPEAEEVPLFGRQLRYICNPGTPKQSSVSWDSGGHNSSAGSTKHAPW
jgi:hypothetical protein